MILDQVIAIRNNKTIYRDGDKCIKVFFEGYPKSDILNEALNQARIEETGLNIPRLLEITMHEGKWAVVSEFIDGKPLSQLMSENPEKKSEYLKLLVDLQLSIHEKTCPLLNKLKDKMNGKIYASSLDATTRYNLHARLENMPRHNKVCHGDFNPSNVIITEDGTPYVIDWSHATQGNASSDAARTYLKFWLDGDIDGARMYLELFCEKSNTPKDYVQKWMPFVAAEQSVMGNEKEKEFLLSWVNSPEI